MHIPDGYLSPQTCAVAYAAAVPCWAAAANRVTKVVKTRNVPLLAILSAVSFLVMMFNIPIPDGTTAHAVGGTMIAIVLGPWAAVIAVSVALLFQALLFGDGGVLAYGANVLNMAVILPFVGYAVYRLVAGRAPLTSARRVTAAGVAGYAGINAAALATAVELGIQPELFHTAGGAPLYAPYHLGQALAAMALAHLTVAGAAEAILTGGVLAYLARADVRRLVPSHPGVPVTPVTPVDAVPRRRLTPVRVAAGFVVVMALLTPLGLLAPGGAFGEGAPGDLDLGRYGLNAVPSGLDRYNGMWSHALLGGYGTGGRHPNLGYLLSAAVGIAVVGAAVLALGLLVEAVARRRRKPARTAAEPSEPSRV
jgi:cobalt/nickel transport system permease protein